MMKSVNLAVAIALGAVTPIALGSTPGADDPVPPAIAGPEARFERALAAALLGSLPPETRAQLQRERAFGTDRAAGAGAGVGAGVLMLGDRYREIEEWVSPEAYALMSDGQADMLASAARRVHAGEPIAAACFAPGTPEEVVRAFYEIQDRATRYQQIGRWNDTATDTNVLGRGNPVTLTYSFVPDGTEIPDVSGFNLGTGPSQLHAWLNGLYGSQAVWQTYFDRVFARWSEVTGNTYIYEPNDDGVVMVVAANPGVLGVRGDIRIGALDFINDGNGGILAFNHYPEIGDMVFDAFDTAYQNTTSDSLLFRNVIAHEHGHGLGMLHVCPLNLTKLMEPNATLAFDGPQLDDILNGQRYYGDTREPDDSPAEATSLGVFAPGVVVSPTEPLSVADNSDFDYFAFDVDVPVSLTISAAPAAGVYLEGAQLATGACTPGTLTNFNIIHDLALAVLGDDGVTEIASSDAASAGQAEVLSADLLPGSYFIEIHGDTSNNIQLYALTVSADVPACYCDLNSVLGLTADDIDVFVDMFVGGSLGADCDGSGALSVDDINCFVQCFVGGCP